MHVSTPTVNRFLRLIAHEGVSRPHQIRSGSSPVIISAPHSVEQLRNGIRKAGEFQTGALALLLHLHCACPCIYKTRNDRDDANFDRESPYKQDLIDYIRLHRVKCLLDLHQLSPVRAEAINIGTGKEANLHKRMDYVKCAVELFTGAELIPVTIDKPFDAVYRDTISATIARECRIPCLQIEINSRLVCERYPEYSFNIVLEMLEKIVQHIAQEVMHRA